MHHDCAPFGQTARARGLAYNPAVMLDAKSLDRIVESVIEALPRVPQDLERKLRVALAGIFDRLELATREELEVQEQVLARTRARLAELERRLAELEERLSKSPGG